MTNEANNKAVCVGIISAAHGIRGAVKVKSFTHRPKDIVSYGILSDETGKQAFEVTILSETKEALIAQIKGVNDRNAAEALRGTKLFVSRRALPQTGPDEFYHVDLIGMDAVTQTGKNVGKVVSVQNYGAGDILEIEKGDGDTELLSFSKANVPDIDIANRRMTVVFPKTVTVKRSQPESVGQ